MEKTFIVHFNQEQGNYLQRLGTEVDSKVFLIDRIFANHTQDTDTLLFDSVPFKHYMGLYEEARYAWELAKDEFKNNYLDAEVTKVTGIENPKYNWQIDDFNSGECVITLV